MYLYLIRRLCELIPSLLLATVLVFLIINASPGDPVKMKLGTEATPEQIEAERANLGLDRPLPVRYVFWLGDVLRLDLGRSFINRQEVWLLIRQRFPATMELALLAMGVAVLIGVPLGAIAALKQNGRIDSFVTGFNALGLSVPVFWLGLLLILLFSVRLGWLPPSGRGDLTANPSEAWKNLAMPVVCLAFYTCSVFARFTRSALIDVLGSDYVRTARAKGLTERVVLFKHVLRNALIPIVTVMGISFGQLLGGAVITESVFSWPGLGRLLVSGIMNKDYSVVQGVLLITVTLFMLVTLCVDILYAFLDPRIKLAK
jgi:peptide/nickel transport system permease protein